MSFFDKLLGRKKGKPSVDVDFTKLLDVVSEYGEVIAETKTLLRPMHELPHSRFRIRSALAFCVSGGAVPRDMAREAYALTESFWPSPAAERFVSLNSRLLNGGATSLSPKELEDHATAIGLVNQGRADRAAEFDLLVKWYEGLIVHRLIPERRLDKNEAELLKDLLEESVAGDAAWYDEIMGTLRGQGENVVMGGDATAEEFAKEVNFIHRDLKTIRQLIDEIP